MRGAADFHRLQRYGQGVDFTRHPLSQSEFQRRRRPSSRTLASTFAFGKFQNAIDEIPEHIGQVLIADRLELFPGERRVARFRRLRAEIPAPIVCGQKVKRCIHKDAPALRGGKLAPIPVEPVEAFQIVDRFPRLARSKQGDGETDRVEGDIVLPHNLDIAHILCACVRPPPAAPVDTLVRRPFPRRGDIFNRRVKPNVKDLVFKARARLAILGNRHPPRQVPGDAAINQALFQMFIGDGAG